MTNEGGRGGGKMAKVDEGGWNNEGDKGRQGGQGGGQRQPQKGDDNKEQEETTHPPPASQATACGVDSGWNDNNSQEKMETQDDGDAEQHPPPLSLQMWAGGVFIWFSVMTSPPFLTPNVRGGHSYIHLV